MENEQIMQDSANQPGFLFHDYETFGTHPALDRPAQFAAIRTDAELNIIGEPEVFYCKLADDYRQPRQRLNHRSRVAALA